MKMLSVSQVRQATLHSLQIQLKAKRLEELKLQKQTDCRQRSIIEAVGPKLPPLTYHVLKKKKKAPRKEEKDPFTAICPGLKSPE